MPYTDTIKGEAAKARNRRERQAAILRLIDRHRAEYEQLLKEERGKRNA